MDIFNDFNNNIIFNEMNIEIWVEQNGQKKNTYISGWDIPNNELSSHLKIVKKKNGCNGTIKTLSNGSEKIQVMQFQGDQSEFIKNYIINQGVNINNICIKG
jgi:translation initiation factor 1 (eIF-1/SUI1)